VSKRDDILDATLDLVVEQGLAAFSFSKLFQRAGVGAGTVYNYFESKDALLEALFADVSSRMDKGVLKHWSRDASLPAQFDTLLRGFALYVVENPREVSFIETCSRTPSIPRKLRERVTPAQKAGLQLISEGQAAGLIRPMAPHLAMAIASGLIASVVGASGSGKYDFGQAELDTVIDASWRALATDAGLRAAKRRGKRLK